MNQILDGVRVLLCLSFLIYASWSDYKTREVSNTVWIILGPLGLVLTVFQFSLFSSEPFQFFTTYGISFAIISALSLAIFYLGGFGGADAKAFMCIALVLPVYPDFLLSKPNGFISPLFPLSIFSNSVLLGAFSVFYGLVRNLIWKIRNNGMIFQGLKHESFGLKLLAIISGYKIKISDLEKGHAFPLEDIELNNEGELERKLLAFPNYEERDDIISRIKEKNLTEWIWVTPGLPLLIFITLGLIAALFIGDLIWLFLGPILGL